MLVLPTPRLITKLSRASRADGASGFDGGLLTGV